MHAEVADEFMKSTILHLAQVILGDSQTAGYVERTGSWQWDSYVRSNADKGRITWKELTILRKLLTSKKLNKYQIRKECSMHQTQVVRAVHKLRRRRAIEIVSHTVWRTGKRSEYYSISAIGLLLLLHERMDNYSTNVLLDGLRSFAVYNGDLLFKRLVMSVDQIGNKQIRRQHTLVLMDLAFDIQMVSRAPKQSYLLCEFVVRAWRDPNGLRAYLGHLPYEARSLLVKAKEALEKGESEIDYVLEQRRLTDYLAS